MSKLPNGFFQSLIDYNADLAYELEEQFEQYCESPIEVAFGVAFVMAARSAGVDVEIFPKSQANLRSGSKAVFYITPQVDLLGYRADFVAGLYIANDKKMVVVECDGHAFHNITKETVSRDRRRDREMQAAGWRVLRFTGSDIHRSAFDCADEVMRNLLTMHREDQSDD
ncbi:endonuclease domain-containing protein [Aureimonas sp. AU20]|uniref:endonuclease domain-containing protein n=1 Tax=Aureimonas sp. AU20 TaxID=1349819 RepID=UPI00071F8C3A|nr:DUF559 domain-containing protein [Aureimonas sp. AU20]ALN73550.1 hypothetical protein M673_12555 [Aureimonas sp. AU20]